MSLLYLFWPSSGVALEDSNGGTFINLLYDLYGPTLAAANLGYVGEGGLGYVGEKGDWGRGD